MDVHDDFSEDDELVSSDPGRPPGQAAAPGSVKHQALTSSSSSVIGPLSAAWRRPGAIARAFNGSEGQGTSRQGAQEGGRRVTQGTEPVRPPHLTSCQLSLES